MSTDSEIDATLPSPSIHKTIGAAIGTVLALVVIATVLIIAAVYPALDRYVIAVAAGTVIGVIGLAVAVAVAIVHRLRLPTNNDAWIFW